MRTWSPGAPHFDFVRLRGWRFVTRDGPIPSLQPPPTTCVCAPVVSTWGVPHPGTRLRVRGFICILLSSLLAPAFLSYPVFSSLKECFFICM